MKHIPTTATAIRKIKLAAKLIKSEQNLILAKALDLAALNAGYENFHHASHCAANTKPEPTFIGLGTLSFVIDETASDWEVLDEDGYVQESVKLYGGRFGVGKNHKSLRDVRDALDELSDEVGGGSGDMTDISDIGLLEIISGCRIYTAREPAFIDGYAHWAGALVALEKNEACIAMALPVFNAVCALIPSDFNGYIPYSYLSNRPFHRLANNLLLAYYGVGKNEEAKSIAQQMLTWWPNDNIGFRFLLTPEEE